MEMSGSAQTEPRVAGYEFSATENVTIEATARWIGIFAWFGIGAGSLMALAGILTLPVGLANVVIGAVYIVIGMWFRGAATSLKSVATTRGDDISHLMTALNNLRSAFMAMVVLVGLGIGLAILAAILIAGAAATGAGV